MKKKIITIVILISLVALVAITLKSNKEDMKKQVKLAQRTNDFIPVAVDIVEKGTIDKSFKVTGNLIPQREVTIASEVNGQVTSIYAKDGQFVTEGTLLAKIDNSVVKQELAVVKINLEKLKKDKAKLEKMVEIGGATVAELDNINLAYARAKSQLASIQKKYDESFIRSPFNGINNNRYVEVGSYVKNGGKMFEIVDISKLKMIANVPEDKIIDIKIGKKVRVDIQVVKGKHFNGEVVRIGSKASQSLTFPVEIIVSNNELNTIKAGMFGTALFGLESNEGLIIPREAIVGSLENPQVYLFKDSIAYLVNVVIISTQRGKVILQEGLEPGDRVITSGQINLSHGAKVGILN